MPHFGDGVTNILLAAEHLGWRVSIGTRITVLVRTLPTPPTIRVTNASDLCGSIEHGTIFFPIRQTKHPYSVDVERYTT